MVIKGVPVAANITATVCCIIGVARGCKGCRCIPSCQVHPLAANVQVNIEYYRTGKTPRAPTLIFL
jgi:hypothetical protein